jgi:archaellum component FlaC
MSKEIPVLSKSRDDVFSFFHKLKVGDIFGFNIKDYLSEEVTELAAESGKIILFCPPESILYEQFGDSTGIVITNVEDQIGELENAQKVKTRRELFDCYKRIEDLETQLGLRGSDRLERCEYCKQPLYSCQSWISTDSGGTAHTDCSLSREIEKLTTLLQKKEEVVKKWTKESQQLADEAHELRVGKRKVSEELTATKAILITTQDLLNDAGVELPKVREQLADSKSRMESLIKKFEIVCITHETSIKTFIKVLDIFRRTRRLLGDGEKQEFTPLSQVKMSGELRVEITGWCQPIYDDIRELSEEIAEFIKE